MDNRLRPVFSSLRGTAAEDVFNPWYDWHSSVDVNRSAPMIRRRHLKQYLGLRKQAPYLFVGEALGYRGGRFSGIPMTSERILLDHMADRGIRASDVTGDLSTQRTSRLELGGDGFTEPTATIVWTQIIQSGIHPNDIVLWNAFPWHPFEPGIGLLSNRKPRVAECHEGRGALLSLLRYLNIKRVVAVGRTAGIALRNAGIEPLEIRHPARGGAREFRRQFINEIMRKL